MNKFSTFIGSKTFSIILAGIFGFFNVLCLFVVPPILYHFAEFNLEFSDIITIFGIDWSVFGIMVAVYGIIATIIISREKDRIGQALLFDSLLVFISMLLNGLLLSATSICLLLANQKLFSSLTFSSLYYLALMFINLLFVSGRYIIRKI